MPPERRDHPAQEPTDMQRRRLLRAGVVLAGGALLYPPAPASAGTSRRAITDYLREDATGLAALVRRRTVSAAELLDIAIARTKAVDTRINAVVLRHFELARTSVARIPRDAPLAGVPWLLKDLNVQLAGTETTNGSRLFAGKMATTDSTVVQRYRAAGLVCFGKSASPEMGRTVTTESTLHGITRNPWNTDFSSGGSSGGASAAVAAGILPAAHATDGGGSIRIPAALCGLFGLKPTRLRTPNGPGRTEGWGGLSVGHAVTRSVRDSALLLDISQGPEPGAAYWPPPPSGSYLGELSRSPGKLRIGVLRASPLGVPVDAECLAAVDAAARLCESLGHPVTDFNPPEGGLELMMAFGTLVGVGFAAAVRERARELGREPGPEDLEAVNLAGYRQALGIPAVDHEQARQTVHAFGFRMHEAMLAIDVVLSPVAARPAWRVGDMRLSQSPEDFYRHLAGASDFTALYNMSGQPAMSVPLHTGTSGLPVGVMFGARYGDEKTLFRLASQLEQATPWAGRLSPLMREALS